MEQRATLARRGTVKNTILGIFNDPIQARQAIDALRASELPIDDVSIVSRATESGAPISSVDDVSAGEGAAVGAVWGGLVGLAALLIPGVGPFITFGALGAALTGLVTGAVVGGISAALIDFSGIPEDEARRYEEQVNAGKTLVAVKLDEENVIEARRILVGQGADSIRDNQTDLTDGGAPVHVATYDASGQSVNQAAEYGAPVNPTTVDRDPSVTTHVEPAPNGALPIVEDSPSVGDPVSAGRAAAVPADSRPNVTSGDKLTTPETLGVPPTELTPDSPNVTTPDHPDEPDFDAPDTNLPRTGQRTM
jgi:uncharacterized membrane protein